MRKPQQAHDKGLDNIPSGEIHYDLAPNGKHRLRYRDLAGNKRAMVVGSEAEVWPKYLAAVKDLELAAWAAFK